MRANGANRNENCLFTSANGGERMDNFLNYFLQVQRSQRKRKLVFSSGKKEAKDITFFFTSADTCTCRGRNQNYFLRVQMEGRERKIAFFTEAASESGPCPASHSTAFWPKKYRVYNTRTQRIHKGTNARGMHQPEGFTHFTRRPQNHVHPCCGND